MAHFDHEGGNKTRFQAYDPAAIIVQKELDLAALPTGPLLGQEDHFLQIMMMFDIVITPRSNALLEGEAGKKKQT